MKARIGLTALLVLPVCWVAMGWAAEMPVASSAPQYSAEPCCELCPAAADERNYNTSMLQSVWPLKGGRDGWIFRAKADLATDFGPKPETMQMLGEFVKALQRRGTQLMMIYTPSRGLMHADKLLDRYDHQLALNHYQQTLSEFRHLGVLVPPLDQLIGHMPGDFYFKRDIHWTPTGARATAQMVAQQIKAQPLYTKLPDKQFVTRRAGEAPINGSVVRAVSELCHQQYPLQYVDTFTTTSQGGEDDLLSDEAPPQQVVVLGTSFTALPMLNFDGFLRQALGKDVLNMALSGGEDRGAWLEYLPTPLFQKSPPALVIWETPSHYSLSEKSLFRQLIPLVDNGCEGKPLLSDSKQTIQPNQPKNELIFNQSLLDKKASSLVMDLQVSDPTVHELEVTAWYGNGNAERFKVKQNSRAKTGGRFVFLLAQDEGRGQQSFISMDLDRVGSKAASVEVRSHVCQRVDNGPLQTASR